MQRGKATGQGRWQPVVAERPIGRRRDRRGVVAAVGRPPRLSQDSSGGTGSTGAGAQRSRRRDGGIAASGRRGVLR
jgi:hypothetical protein